LDGCVYVFVSNCLDIWEKYRKNKFVTFLWYTL